MLRSAILACSVFIAASAYANPEYTADDLLDRVISQLPRKHIRAEGTMFVRKLRGVPQDTYRFTLDAKWIPPETRVNYVIQDANGSPIEALTFQPDSPDMFAFRNGPDLAPAPIPDLSANIARTDLSWLDLSLYFLWWRGARFAGYDEVRGVDCRIVEVDAPADAPPGAYAKVRLWISDEQAHLFQAEGFDKSGNPIRRLWIQSIKKVDEQWIIQTLEVQQQGRNQRTRLHIADVKTVQDQTP